MSGHKQCMPPVGATDARLLVLGSLPGDASLAAQAYYAHPTNQFWRLLGGAIGEELADLAYPDRLDRLALRGIALWDVVADASRTGSLDGAIRVRPRQSARGVRRQPPLSCRHRVQRPHRRHPRPPRTGRVRGASADRLAILKRGLHPPAGGKNDRLECAGRLCSPACFRQSAAMTTDEPGIDEDDAPDPQLSMVDEALVAGNIANTNGLLVIVAKLVARGIFDKDDLKAFSDTYSKPLDHEGMRENELVSQMQDQMEFTLAELMRYISEQE